MARLAAYDAGDVSMTGRIISEHDVAGPETANRAVAGFDLDLARKRDDILAPRRRVEIA